MNYLYRDVIQWVKRSIELVGNSKSLNLYIKTHPAEKYDKSKTLKGVADIMRRNLVKIYPKMFFLLSLK